MKTIPPASIKTAAPFDELEPNTSYVVTGKNQFAIIDPSTDHPEHVFVSVLSRGLVDSTERPASRKHIAATLRALGFNNLELATIEPSCLSGERFGVEKCERADWDRTETRIYFMQPEGGGPIKIGRSVRVNRRKMQIQPMCPFPLVVLGEIFSGDPALETELHRRFKHLRIHGEWFTPSPELLDYIHHNVKVHA